MVADDELDPKALQEEYLAWEQLHNRRVPTARETLERAARLASNAVRTVDLQIRRLRGEEPEDEEWVFRAWSDFQFLIFALWNVRLAGQLALTADETLNDELTAFDAACPDLATMRHVSQHLDEYGIDHVNRRQRRPDSGEVIGRRALEVGSWSEDQFSWLGGSLDLNAARGASASLYTAIRRARDASNWE